MDPQIEDRDLICELTKHSSVLYGMFTDMLRRVYSSPNCFIKGCPSRLFDFDKNKTQIWIDKEMRWQDEHPEFRPAIYIKLGKIGYTYPMDRRAFATEPHTSTNIYLRGITGVVSFVHIAKTAGEANILCDNTLDYMWSFSQAIKQDFCLSDFRPIEQTPVERAPQASKEQWMSTCSCKFEAYDVTGITPEAPVLSEIKLTALQNKVPDGILRTDLEKPRQGQG